MGYRNDNSRRESFVSAGDNGPAWNLHKLYGREQESKIIQDHIDKLSTRTLILKGISGSGKTALIESQSFEEDGWIFATGTYEEHRKNEPYTALIEALGCLVDEWIKNNENAEICKMKSFSTLLDQDVALLANILPKVFRSAKSSKCKLSTRQDMTKIGTEVIGDAGMVNASFWRIISFLCEAKPVVLFLDGLQWADKVSLDAIRILASTGNIEGFFLVLSYREEEVNKDDLVFRCINCIEEESDNVNTIRITNLDVENINAMVSSLLEKNPELTSELSRVIHSKTAGNPFFVSQFIQILRHEHFLSYSSSTLQWEWGEVDKMEQLAHVSDNIADVVAGTMSKLPVPSLLALKVASCLGKVIPLQIMIEFFGSRELLSINQVVCDALRGVQLQGLKLILDSSVEFGILRRLDDSETYLWSHDKLQHVTYSMISACFLQKIHTVLGKVLWKNSKLDPENEWMLYMAAEQLNRFIDIKDDSLSEDFARLSFDVGKLSISKSAYFPAYDMIQFASKHLDAMADPWGRDTYELSLDVYSYLAEMALKFGDSDEALNISIRVNHHAKSLEDKIRAQVVTIYHNVQSINRDYLGGIEAIKNILLDYGVKIPQKFLTVQLHVEKRKLKSRLGGNLEAILSLPKLDNDDKRTGNIIKLLVLLLEHTHIGPKKMDMSLYAITRVLNVSVKSGTCSETALALGSLASYLSSEGHHEDAMECGELAIKLVSMFPKKVQHYAKVQAIVTFGVLPASLPFYDSLEPLLELNQCSLMAGEINSAAMAWIGYSYTYLNIGLPLGPLNSDLLSFSKSARQFGMPPTINVIFPILLQTIQNLQVLKPNPTMLLGDIFNQEQELKRFKDIGLKMTQRDINSLRLFLACIYRKWEIAEELVGNLQSHIQSDKFIPRKHLYLVYMGYACLILGEKARRTRRIHFRQLGKKVINIFKDQLKQGSKNALYVILMLEAIESPSKEKFHEAIRATSRLGIVHHTAVIYENAGIYFMDQDDEGRGEYYLSQAYNYYKDWGATGKANQLKDSHEVLNSSTLNHHSKGGGSFMKGRTRFSPKHINQMKELRLTSGKEKIKASTSATESSFTLHLTSSSSRGNSTTDRKSSSSSIFY